MQLGIRRLSLGHLDRGDAQAPNVGLVVVATLLYSLRGHPVGCADEAVAQIHVSNGRHATEVVGGETNVFFLVIVAVSWPETPKSASLTAEGAGSDRGVLRELATKRRTIAVSGQEDVGSCREIQRMSRGSQP